MNFSARIILFTSVLLVAIPAQATNLLQAYQHAKAYDPQVKSQLETHKATQESIVQAKAALKPSVTVTGSSSVGSSDTTGSATGSYHDNFNFRYSADVTKALYRKDLQSRLAAANASVAQSKASLDAQQQNLMIRVARPYFNVLLAMESLRFAQAEKEAIGKQLEQTKAYFEAGTLAITDVKEAQASYDQSVSSVIDAKNQVALAKESLRVVTGQSYKQFSGNSARFKLEKPNPNNADAWARLAEKNNKNLIIAKQAVNVAEKELERQRSLKKPTVNLFASHSGNFTDGISDNLVTSNRYDNSVGVSVSVPLYSGGASDSRIRGASHSYKSAGYNAELQKQLATQQVRSAYLTVMSDISQISALQQSLSSTETALEATQAGFEVGTRTAVDVLLALRNTFGAKLNLAQARYNYLLNYLLLHEAAGTLSERDMQKITGMLGR